MGKRTLLLIAVVALSIFALSPQWQSVEQMGERRSLALRDLPKEILVGICWPFSVNNDGMADGLLLALDEINSTRLAGGIPVRLVMRDDRLNWEDARKIAREFSNTPKMSAVIGFYDDAPAIKASVILESSRLLHLVVGANSTAMTSRGLQYIIRTILSSDKIGHALAQMAIQRGYKKIALIREEGPYGEDLAYQFQVALDAQNMRLAYEWSYQRDRADFRSPISELRRIDTDLIFFAGLEPWAGDFIRLARRAGLKTQFLGAFSDTPEMRVHAGSAIEGAIYFDEYDVASRAPESKAFVQKFRKRYGKDPDTWAAQGYDALHILAKAVKATSSAEPLDLVYSIRFMDAWTGANGRYKFDSRGELEDKPIYLNIYRNGVPESLPAGLPIPAPPHAP